MAGPTMVTGSRLAYCLVFICVAVARVNADWSSVLTWEVENVTFIFTKDKFLEFYKHLCDTTTYSIDAYRFYDWVEILSTETFDDEHIGLNSYSHRYMCWKILNQLYCQRLEFDDDGCTDTDKCWSYRVVDETARTCGLNSLEIIWAPRQSVQTEYYNQNIISIIPCVAGCDGSTVTNTAIMQSSTVTANVLSPNQTSASVDNHKDTDTSAIIVGVVVGVVVLAAILVVIGVVFWKRKRERATDNSSSARHNGHRAVMQFYSVPSQAMNIKDMTPGQPSWPENPYEYATIDPMQTTLSNDAVGVIKSEDFQYYNQDAFGGDPDGINNCSFVPELQGPDYYNMGDGQDILPADISTEVNASLNIITDDNSLDTDGAYSVIDDDNDRFSANPRGNGTQGSKGSADHAYVNPVVSAMGKEYSKLHDPLRRIKNQYDALLPPNGDGKQDICAGSTSSSSTPADHASFTYSLAQPILEHSSNHVQPIEIIDVGSLSQQLVRIGDSSANSELSIRKGQAIKDRGQVCLKEDQKSPLYSNDNGSETAAPDGQFNEYLELVNII